MGTFRVQELAYGDFLDRSRASGTASLSAQKDFLGGGVVKNNPIFVKQILLHHIYANIWEFIWTKCVTHLLVFLI